jgi:malate permease and related proteins
MVEIVLPVVVMLLMGMMLRRKKLLTDQGVNEMKTLITGIILPVAIFHALMTANYTQQTWILVGLMLLFMVLSFGIGFLLRPLLPKAFAKYVPYLVSVYEGGMIAYPLYTSLCGAENLSNVALLDIAGLLFGFSVYMNLLAFDENGEKASFKGIVCSTLKSPPFIATVLGTCLGISGLGGRFLQTAVGAAYLAAEQLVTAPLSALVLLIVGYSIQFRRDLLSPCMKTVLLRFLLQAAMTVCMLLCVHHFIGQDRLTDLAIVIYMSAPTTFSMQSFVRDPNGSAYVSTVNALYFVVSLAVFAVAAGVL